MKLSSPTGPPNTDLDGYMCVRKRERECSSTNACMIMYMCAIFSNSDGWSLLLSHCSLWSLPPHLWFGIHTYHQLGHTTGELLHAEVIKQFCQSQLHHLKKVTKLRSITRYLVPRTQHDVCHCVHWLLEHAHANMLTYVYDLTTLTYTSSSMCAVKTAHCIPL